MASKKIWHFENMKKSQIWHCGCKKSNNPGKRSKAKQKKSVLPDEAYTWIGLHFEPAGYLTMCVG